MQTYSSRTAPAASLLASAREAKDKTPHTRSSLSSTINIQERVAAAEKAIKKRFALLVEFIHVDVSDGVLSIIFRDIYRNRIIEASSTDWRHLTFFDCEAHRPLTLR